MAAVLEEAAPDDLALESRLFAAFLERMAQLVAELLDAAMKLCADQAPTQAEPSP